MPNRTNTKGTKGTTALNAIFSLLLLMCAVSMAPVFAQLADEATTSNSGSRNGNVDAQKVGSAFARGLNLRGRKLDGGFGWKNRKTDRFWLGAGDMAEKDVVMEGVTRKYYVYTPANAKTGVLLPLVLVFHGGGGTARGADYHIGGMTKVADKYGFIVVFAQGVDRHWNDGRPGLVDHYYDDVTFVWNIIETLVKSGKVDRSRVYATGISNGGFFSQYLGIMLPGKLAAVASVAASVSTNFQNIPVKQPLPIMFLLGTEDTLVPWLGGSIGGEILKKKIRGAVISGRESVDFWLAKNGNSAKAERVPLDDTNPDDGSKVFVEQYGADNSSNEVVLVEIQGGGHTWPSGQQYLPVKLIGPVCKDFDANEMIWTFFSKHSLQTK